jgi:hypothetical protein
MKANAMIGYRLSIGFIACLAAGLEVGAGVASSPSESSKFIYGVVNSEDLVTLPGARWVIASGMNGPGVPAGRLLLIDVGDRSVEKFYPARKNRYRRDGRLFSACPGKPDEEKFVPHGLNIRSKGNGRYMLYVVNHGDREAVEIFEVDTRRDRLEITWVGCVRTPMEAHSNLPWMGNSIAPLSDDAFALTVNPPVDSDDPKIVEKMIQGRIAGRVMIWSPGSGWRDVPGSELLFDNGIEASRDGKWLYVAASGEPGIYRLSLGRVPVDRVMLKTSFHPDNIRWGDDGFLYVTGPAGKLKEVITCAQSSVSCAIPFKVIRIDPRTLQSEELVNEPGDQSFGLATGVAKVGNEIWLSTPRGTRIATFPLNKAEWAR